MQGRIGRSRHKNNRLGAVIDVGKTWDKQQTTMGKTRKTYKKLEENMLEVLERDWF